MGVAFVYAEMALKFVETDVPEAADHFVRDSTGGWSNPLWP